MLADNSETSTIKVSLDVGIHVFLNSCFVFENRSTLNSTWSLSMGLFPTASDFPKFLFYEGKMKELGNRALQRELEAREY